MGMKRIKFLIATQLLGAELVTAGAIKNIAINKQKMKHNYEINPLTIQK